MTQARPPGDPDESVSRLDDASRHLAATTAARRAELELRGAAAFTAVTQSLIDLRADVRIVALSAQAIAEELRHSEIYLSLARAYATGDVEAPRPAPIEVPRFPGVGSDGERVLQVVGMCAINETMACAFLELCLGGATVPFVRAALREVLEDEIRHARIGWAYLGSPDVAEAERRLVSAWLAPMLQSEWALWRGQIATLPEGGLPGHGCPSPEAIAKAALTSIVQIVVPGFERAGVDASAARRWAAGISSGASLDALGGET